MKDMPSLKWWDCHYWERRKKRFVAFYLIFFLNFLIRTKIKLTIAGETLLQYTTQLFAVYNNLEFDLNTLAQRKSGKLRIGASTTVAQYVLPPVLADFHTKFKDIKDMNEEELKMLKVLTANFVKYNDGFHQKYVLGLEKNNSLTDEVSISPTFYDQLFYTKVFWKAFLYRFPSLFAGVTFLINL